MIGGFDIDEPMLLLIPEAWEKNKHHSNQVNSYFNYHSKFIEPWDGPAAMCFTDGKKIGAILDRNGLRPSRYLVTDDGTVLLSSEMGVLPIEPSSVKKRWRLQPGKIFLIDLIEKQKLLETITTEKKIETLSNIIDFNLHDERSEKKTIQ